MTRTLFPLATGAIALVAVAAAICAVQGYGLPFMAGALLPYGAAAVLMAGHTAALRNTDFGFANAVTLTRLIVACLFAGLAMVILSGMVTHAIVLTPRDAAIATAIGVTVLCLDGVDGWLARRFRTASAFGARFDMEVDAFLILILAVIAWAMGKAGAWVLLSGFVRYIYVVAATVFVALQHPLFPSLRRKTVAVIQASVLVALLAPIVVPPVSTALAAGALALLLYSFAADIWWQLGGRRVDHAMAILAAVGLLDLILVLPDRSSAITPMAFLHIAVALPFVLAFLWAVPKRGRGIACGMATAVLLIAIALKFANMAIFTAFQRPFDASADPRLIAAGWDLLVRSHGLGFAVAAAVFGAGVLIGIGFGLRTALQVIAAAAPRRGAIIALALGAVALLMPSTWTSHATERLFADQARILLTTARAEQEFHAQLARDPLNEVAEDRLYAALKDHDVLLVFVESYGRVMLDDPRYADTFGAQLDVFTAHLTSAGFGARSAWLTSPTFGGESWFAHSTVVSGLWVNDQHRYDGLVRSTRPTMIADFHRAGWRTLAVMPEIADAWPERAYFGYDAVYDAPTLHFAGQPFAYVNMADQFTLARLQDSELASRDRAPVMAEIALVSSHAPWTPLPKLVPWDQVGDGTIFDQARVGDTPQQVWDDPEAVRRQYALSISYVMTTLESFVLTYATDRTVLIVMGDHQPMAFISGEDATREVPVHIIARDPNVLAAFETWHWTDGMRPDANSPTSRMDSLRERLVRTFSPSP